MRIGEVFSNLLTNAIKYNQKQNNWIEIGFISLFRRDTTEPDIFYVRDNGIDIRQKNYDAIFQIFRHPHGRDKYGGGMGTGLTIVKHITERHGGRIWLKSRYGEGTTSYFALEKGADHE